MRKSEERRAAELALVMLLGLFGVALGWALFSLASFTASLRATVAGHLPGTGLANPVTAVLLDFRAYDTLLEMAVLWLAVLGVRGLGAVPPGHAASPGAVLDLLPRLLVPVLVVVAGYLLWVGSMAPGGAFQAGSVLGAAGVLLLLAGSGLPHGWRGRRARLAMVAGLIVFIGTAWGTLLANGRMLAYPSGWTKALILFIETVATLSIGFILMALFLGGRPPGEEE